MSFKSSPRASSAPGTHRSSTASDGPRAYGLPLRSKPALEPPDFSVELPSPPPPLRDGVTEVHYSRWVVEEANKEVRALTPAEHASSFFSFGFLLTRRARSLSCTHRSATSSGSSSRRRSPNERSRWSASSSLSITRYEAPCVHPSRRSLACRFVCLAWLLALGSLSLTHARCLLSHVHRWRTATTRWPPRRPRWRRCG